MSVTFNMIELGRATAISGDVRLPPRLSATFEFEEDHTIELDVSTVSGQPVCEAIRVIRNPNLEPLSGTELRRLPIARFVRLACEEAAIVREEPGKWAPVTTEHELERVSQVVDQSQRRRRITDEFLRSVAAVYVEAEEAGFSAPEMVREACHVSLSQAFRYIKAARDRGILRS